MSDTLHSVLGWNPYQKKCWVVRRNVKIAPITLFWICCCSVALKSTHTKTEKLLSLHHCCLSWQETEYSSHWGKMGHYSHCPGSFIQNNPLKVDRSTLNELKGGLIFGDNTSWLFDVGFCDNVLRSLIFRKLGSHKILLYWESTCI